MSAEWQWSHPSPCPYPYPLPDGTDLQQRLSRAEQTLSRLSERLEQAERQLEELKNKAPMHIEYHFDQLKVNELRGTLNVGLSPQGAQGIESFEAPIAQWPETGGTAAGPDSGPIALLVRQMEAYMDTDAPAILSGLEQQFEIRLDQAHRDRLLADVKGQLRERVHYYAKISPYPAEGAEEERRIWRQNVIDRTTRDIHSALSAYVEHWQNRNANGQGGVRP